MTHSEEITESYNVEINNEVNNFSYERDLKNSIVYQIPDLFQGYRIYGSNNEGIEYLIEGKRIDILLENIENGNLLIIELKAGSADYKVFGQISMYMGLLQEKFQEKDIYGCIIAGMIDRSLRSASKTSNKVSLKSYSLRLILTDE